MTGYNDIMRIKRLEKEAHQLGFRLGLPKNGHYNREFGDMVAVFPRDDKLPVYSRDAELYIGTLESVDIWMRGIEWARQYDTLIMASDDEVRQRKEQDELNRQLVYRLKDEKLNLRNK
jgi:hypothetical protein